MAIQKILIIGNGAAGNAALDAILSTKKECQITMLTEEREPFYYRPLLSEFISAETLPPRFYLKTPESYQKENLTLIDGIKATRLVPEEKKVILEDGTFLSYDKLIFAAGSKNFIPPIPGYTLPQVATLKTLENANFIKSLSPNMTKAVIIGGGLLGLELAWQLKKLNIDVTVVERMDRLMPKQLDEAFSKLFECKVLATGIKLIKNAEVSGINGAIKVESVSLKSGETLNADGVFFSIGIRANMQLLKDEGAKVTSGIVVNDKMATSLEHVYAAGDCAVFEDVNYAIWPEAMAQGKIAGLNAIGETTTYKPILPFHLYHGLDTQLFSMGDIGHDPSKVYTTLESSQGNGLVKVYVCDGVIVGALAMDDVSKSSALRKAISTRMPLSDFKEAFPEFM